MKHFTVEKVKNLYAAGLLHGRMAGVLIRHWFDGKEMTQLDYFAGNKGKIAFNRYIRDNSDRFPDLVDEMRGIAEGARVPLRMVWVANLRTELRNLCKRSYDELNCTTVCVADPEMNLKIAIHNEDTNVLVQPYLYLVTYRLPEVVMTGLVYPGMILGNSVTWSSRGFFLTENALYPDKVSEHGLGCKFVQRNAIENGLSVEDIVNKLGIGDQAVGANTNVFGINSDYYGVEVMRDEIDITKIVTTSSKGTAIFVHTNHYLNDLMRSQSRVADMSVKREERVLSTLEKKHTIGDLVRVMSTEPVCNEHTAYSFYFDMVRKRVVVYDPKEQMLKYMFEM